MTTWIRRIGRLVTGGPEGTLDGAGVVVDGRVVWVGGGGDEPTSRILAGDVEEVDVGGGLVTAGLVDAHTHPVYAGERHAELAARSAGLAYTELGEEAGIRATVAATRAADRETLDRLVRGRLQAMLATGTTTVEAKTGYHLDRDGELADVATLRRAAEDPALPGVHVTFLAAHAVPPGWDGPADDYVDQAASWSAAAARAGADACDVFCDEGYFTVAQGRRVLEAGRAAGLQLRIHADELARTGGALLAAEVGAASADHLLHVTAEDARALAQAGVVATLCPSTALSIGRSPDVAALREAGVVIALGSDHNPGTSGITSMSLVVALAVWGLGMSVGEALAAATVGGARSLRRDGGVVAPGAPADLVAWDADHEGAFAWDWGLAAREIWCGGVRVTAGDATASRQDGEEVAR